MQSLPDVDLVVHCAGAVKECHKRSNDPTTNLVVAAESTSHPLCHSESLWIGRRAAQVDEGRCEEGAELSC